MSSIFCFYDQILLGPLKRNAYMQRRLHPLRVEPFACSARIYDCVLHIVEKELNLIEGYDMIA